METQTSMLSHRPAGGMPASAGHHGCARPSQDGMSGRRARKGDVTEVSRDMGNGVVGGACRCGAAWQTWQRLLFPSKTKSQSTPVCPVPRQEGHKKPSVGLAVTRIYLRGVLGDAEGGARYL